MEPPRFFLSNAYLNIPFTIIFQILKMIYLFNPVESFLGVNNYNAIKIYKLCPYIQISRMMRRHGTSVNHNNLRA